MRSIIFWLLVFVVCVVGWVVAVVFSVITFGKFNFLANFFGVGAMVSLFLGLFIEIFKKLTKRGKG